MVRCGRGTQLLGETLCDVYKGVGCGKQRPVVDFKEGVRFRGEGEGDEGGPPSS